MREEKGVSCNARLVKCSEKLHFGMDGRLKKNVKGCIMRYFLDLMADVSATLYSFHIYAP